MDVKKMIDNMLKTAEAAAKKANREGFPVASMNMSMSMSVTDADDTKRNVDVNISKQGDEDPEISVVDKTPRVYVDFHNTDTQGRIRLTTRGTQEDIKKQEIELRTGMLLKLYDDEIEGVGLAYYSEEEKRWVAEINWNNLKLIDCRE